MNKVYDSRLEENITELKSLYMQLYNDNTMFDDLLKRMRLCHMERKPALKRLDARRVKKSEWYKDNKMLGMMFYIDNFSENMMGVIEKLDYIKASNVNYIHLMPFLDVTEGKSDGGYAVKDFSKVREDLGTMEELSILTDTCHKMGISVCMDFVMNHTSEDHAWAVKAKQGDQEYKNRYFFYDSYDVPRQYEETVPQVFPSTAPGNFTWLPEQQEYVMTSFYPYQWDLNYKNPVVFNEMMSQFLFFGNKGIDIIRIDAVPYIWKQLGTNCRNLPQVHTIIRMMRIIGEIVCPGVLLLGEVVMEPSKVVPYFGSTDSPECHMLYNVTTMATIWHTVATRDVRLLKEQLNIVSSLPKSYVFLNYLRCHDDIGWGLDYEFLNRLGMNEIAHKNYLNAYFLGHQGYSTSRGELYNYDPVTQDGRMCGTTASLCGIEKAGFESDVVGMERAIDLDVMLHAYMFFQSGIPILYSGDEIGQVNDYSYKYDSDKAGDSRYIHRGKMKWENVSKIEDEQSVEARIYKRLMKLIEIRKAETIFANQSDVITLETGDNSVLAIKRIYQNQEIIGVFNFSENEKCAHLSGCNGTYVDLISEKSINIDEILLGSYTFYWLRKTWQQ